MLCCLVLVLVEAEAEAEAEPYPGRELCLGRYSVLFDLRRGKPPSALVEESTAFLMASCHLLAVE